MDIKGNNNKIGANLYPNRQAENGLQSRSSEHGKTAVHCSVVLWIDIERFCSLVLFGRGGTNRRTDIGTC